MSFLKEMVQAVQVVSAPHYYRKVNVQFPNFELISSADWVLMQGAKQFSFVTELPSYRCAWPPSDPVNVPPRTTNTPALKFSLTSWLTSSHLPLPSSSTSSCYPSS